MQSLGSKPVFGVELARRPDYTSNSEVAQGVGLIPVSVDGAGVQVGCVEQKEEKSGIFRSDMACRCGVFGASAQK